MRRAAAGRGPGWWSGIGARGGALSFHFADVVAGEVDDVGDAAEHVPGGLQGRGCLRLGRLKAAADAQGNGQVTSEFTPVELLALIQELAVSWGTMNPEFASSASRVSSRDRRRAVVEAVSRLVA